MNSSLVLPMMGISIPILFVIGTFLLGALAIWKGGVRPGAASDEEARLMQEIYNGLAKMDNRVESLETLMMDEREEPKPV